MNSNVGYFHEYLGKELRSVEVDNRRFDSCLPIFVYQTEFETLIVTQISGNCGISGKQESTRYCYLR